MGERQLVEEPRGAAIDRAKAFAASLLRERARKVDVCRRLFGGTATVLKTLNEHSLHRFNAARRRLRRGCGGREGQAIASGQARPSR